MLVIVPLPNRKAERATNWVDPSRCSRFESGHKRRYRSRLWSVRVPFFHFLHVRLWSAPVPCKGDRRSPSSDLPIRQSPALVRRQPIRIGRPPCKAGRPPVAPTIDHDNNALQMVGHHNPGVQFNLMTDLRRTAPLFRHNLSDLVQPHLSVHNLSEQTFFIPGAGREKIGPRLRRKGQIGVRVQLLTIYCVLNLRKVL